jgi:hypothetical protein
MVDGGASGSTVAYATAREYGPTEEVDSKTKNVGRAVPCRLERDSSSEDSGNAKKLVGTIKKIKWPDKLCYLELLGTSM